jgi:hypothetical protein
MFLECCIESHSEGTIKARQSQVNDKAHLDEGRDLPKIPGILELIHVAWPAAGMTDSIHQTH